MLTFAFVFDGPPRATRIAAIRKQASSHQLGGEVECYTVTLLRKKSERPSTTSTTIGWDEAVKAVAPHVHHRVSGAHALGGERHDKEALHRWFERLGRVLPTLHITVNNIWVKGWPWHTTVFAQWHGAATLLNGDASCVNRGYQVFTLRWGRVYALEEFQDSQEVARGLAPRRQLAAKKLWPNHCKLVEARPEARAF